MRHKCHICYQEDLPEGELFHPKCSKRIFSDGYVPELPYLLADMKSLARKIIQSQQAVTGVQAKISMGIGKTKKERGHLTLMTGDYILKPPSEKYPQMPENEDLTMHLAEIVGIKTVSHALVPLASGELAYITKRMDRAKKRKVHMEDLCQLSGILTENKYLSTLERMSKVVAEYSSAPGFDLVKLFELTLFCYITGNNDMHLKNFSLIDLGGWQLSPAYDLLNVHLINPIDKEETALSINGRKRNLKKSDFHFLGLSFKLSETQMANAFEMITSSKERMIECINKSFLMEETKHIYSSLLEKRIQILS